MKTEREQIEAMATILSNYSDKHQYDLHEPEIEDLAIELCNAGYGDVSEYKSEIERSKKETSDTRKGIAKEILQILYDKCYEINDETGESMGNFVSDDDILYLAKHYGVEVKI